MPGPRPIPGSPRRGGAVAAARHRAHRIHPFLPRELPPALEPLTGLALDVRWTWCYSCDALWREIDPEAWGRQRNPWLLLQEAPAARLEALAADPAFLLEVRRLADERDRYLGPGGWFTRAHPAALRAAAYFSLEFGFGEGLPLYAGGLGVLAADLLKAASDLAVPVVGVGLLYQEGYFRQMVDASGAQQETYPYNDPLSLPIQPALDEHGGWIRVALELPARRLSLRVWRVVAGRSALYLLDSNDPQNSPLDRGITAKLYGGSAEVRLLQELVLGVGGWRALEAAGVATEVCHLNEGHAAFAAIERARRFAAEHGTPFDVALWATRAGNLFTTHTPVAAGFDRFPPALIEKYFGTLQLSELGVPVETLLALGRSGGDRAEPFNMAWLAARTCARSNGVSRVHGEVSRRLFADLFPRWPLAEVPVEHVTNGVHTGSWDSARADRLWTAACGQARWHGTLETIESDIDALRDEELWAFRNEARRELVEHARERLARHLRSRGAAGPAAAPLDPAALTLGFARRFTAYKRPGLLLADEERFARLLTRADRPVQIVVAGKAHPADEEGKRLVQAWVAFANRPDVRSRAVFLEDYDIAVAQELVGGVDLWINTPLRPWEACGTSGMKVLVNGGLNLSEIDGWWAEAWDPALGWALGRDARGAGADADEAYRILEEEVVPAFYDRDAAGIPRAWIDRMRASMSRLTARFSANRMVREYADRFYVPAAEAYRRRSAGGGRVAGELARWSAEVRARWGEVRILAVNAAREEDGWRFEARVDCGALPGSVRVEAYADAAEPGGPPVRVALERGGAAGASEGGHVWRGHVWGDRPASDFTVRVLPDHPEARVPAEEAHIAWAR